MQLPVCYNPNITKWPNIGTVFGATVSIHDSGRNNDQPALPYLLHFPLQIFSDASFFTCTIQESDSTTAEDLLDLVEI